MKKILLVSALIMSASCMWGFECSDNPMLEETNKKLKQLSEISTQIADRQKLLENLKSREIRSVWDIVSRNSRENSLQRRNRLSLEISALEEKSASLKQEISSASDEIFKIGRDCASDDDFGRLFAEVMAVKASVLLSEPVLTPDELKSAGQTPEALELLRYRLEIQLSGLSAVKDLMQELKASKTAFMKADRASPAAVIEKLTGEMEQYEKMIIDSNKLIRELLKEK